MTMFNIVFLFYFKFLFLPNGPVMWCFFLFFFKIGIVELESPIVSYDVTKHQIFSCVEKPSWHAKGAVIDHRGL